MAMRVATFAMNNRLLTEAMRLQAQVSNMQVQEASGLKSTDYAGLGSGTKQIISLQTSVTRSKSYESAATEAGSRVEMMYDTVGSMVDLLTQYKSELNAMTQNTSDNDQTLQSNTEQMLAELVALMNTQYEGRYLFSGSQTGTAPVDLSQLTTTATATSGEDTSYYKGNDTAASVRVSSEQQVSYGVTANDAGFEKALRALNIIAGLSSGSYDSDTVDAVTDLLDEAVEALTGTQTKLSLDANTLESAVSEQQAYQDFASGLASDLSSVDVAEVEARMSTYETQLEAAYAALGKMGSITLLNYLD